MTTTDDTRTLFAQAGLDLDNTDQPFYAELTMTAQDLIDAGRYVRDLAVALTRDCERIIARVDGGHHLNPLGEIQAAGPRLDVAIATREARAEAWRRMSRMAAKANARAAAAAGAAATTAQAGAR